MFTVGCASTESRGGSASIPRITQSAASEPASERSSEPSLVVQTDTTKPPSATSLPSAQPSADPSASPSPVPSGIAGYRASGLWHDLGSAQQAGGIVDTVMKWRNPEGAVGPIPNGPELWSQIMPDLRDQLLTRHINDGAIPAPVFAGTPYQTTQSVRVVTWWTNGPSGTGGRGQLMMVFAGWRSQEGIDHIDVWPVLIGFGAGGQGPFKAGRVIDVGPLVSMPTAELAADQVTAFSDISAKVHAWMQSHAVTEDPIDLPCPEQGCST
ncbi:hypothetical protein [Stomatohabitans albus]|uniref:hypothetical protein n=1 Tax=Stomatohabitans albus TaxID=3110766 RepID=UPI00300D38BF